MILIILVKQIIIAVEAKQDVHLANIFKYSKLGHFWWIKGSGDITHRITHQKFVILYMFW